MRSVRNWTRRVHNGRRTHILLGNRCGAQYACAMLQDTSVLVVDDDADVLYAARIALSSADCQVRQTRVPNELTTLLSAEVFDVVLLDMNFVPGARDGAAGMDALATVQAVDPQLAVVLMTAYGSLSLAVDALKRGAVDFLLKPWRNDKLVSAVVAAAQLTRRRRAEAELGLEGIERRAIEQALERHQRNISLAAAALGLSRPALYRRMLKYGL